MKSSNGGRNEGEKNIVVRVSDGTHTHTHTLSLFVDFSKTQLTSLSVAAEDDGPSHERQPMRTEE